MIASLVALLAVGWLLLIVLSPVLPTPVGVIVYFVGSQICHQRADRSFHLFDAQLAVCARCSGIYVGAALGAVIGLASRIGKPSPQWSARRLLVLGAVPTLITWLAEWAGLWVGTNVGRALAGVPLGLAVGVVVMRAVATLHYVECAPRPPIASNHPSIRT